MIRIPLSRGEVEQLEAVLCSAAERKLRDRVQIVLLAHKGKKHQDIAAGLAISPRTVQRWLNAWRERGLDGLRPRKARGRTPAIPATLAGEIRRWVSEGPAGQGLDRAHWTCAGLADHLLRRQGIRASRSATQRFLQKLGVRLYRPGALKKKPRSSS